MSSKPIKIPCKICGCIRSVKTNGELLESYIKRSPFCRSCAEKKAKNTGWFTVEKSKGNTYRKGIPAWNKGIKGIHLSRKSEYKKGQNIEKNNNKWKGDDVGYFGLHTWVQRRLGKAKKCSQCNSIKNVQWANKSWNYKRDINDWIELCINCHRKYDMKNWGEATRRFNL